MRSRYEVADMLHKHWPQVEQHPAINSWQLRTLGAIMRCRTAAMGGHTSACSDCGLLRISYNSCRNRHCPKCQGKQREQWLGKREADLLPVPYFHVVFTLPDLLNPLCLYQPKAVYDTLFEAAWETLLVFAQDKKHLGAKPGMIAVLHTCLSRRAQRNSGGANPLAAPPPALYCTGGRFVESGLLEKSQN